MNGPFTNSLLNAFEAENDSKKSVWLTRRSDIVVMLEASGHRKPGFLIIMRPTVKTLPDDTLDDGFICGSLFEIVVVTPFTVHYSWVMIVSTIIIITDLSIKNFSSRHSRPRYYLFPEKNSCISFQCQAFPFSSEWQILVLLLIIIKPFPLPTSDKLHTNNGFSKKNKDPGAWSFSFGIETNKE